MSRVKINNGVKNKFVDSTFLDVWLNDGWKIGWYNQEELNLKSGAGVQKHYNNLKKILLNYTTNMLLIQALFPLQLSLSYSFPQNQSFQQYPPPENMLHRYN